MIWWCRCPQPVEDDYGKRGTCQAAARIVALHGQWSTSGPVLLATIHCDAGHRPHQLYEEVVLLA